MIQGFLLWGGSKSCIFGCRRFFLRKAAQHGYFLQPCFLPGGTEPGKLIHKQARHDFTYAFSAAVSDLFQILASGDSLCQSADGRNACPVQAVGRPDGQLQLADIRLLELRCEINREPYFTSVPHRLFQLPCLSGGYLPAEVFVHIRCLHPNPSEYRGRSL